MNTHTVTLDRFTRAILVSLTVLLTIIALELWAGRPDALPTARAQIPDTGMQRQQVVEEARRTNRLLEQILEHLRTKVVKVNLEGADKPGGKTARPDRS